MHKNTLFIEQHVVKESYVTDYFTMTPLMKMYCFNLGNMARQSIWFERLGNTRACGFNRLKTLFD